MLPSADNPRRRRRGARQSGQVGALFFCILIVPSLIGWGRAAIECRMFGGGPPAQSATAQPPAGAGGAQGTGLPSTYARPEEQTYLTLPEWYIVYSADEYAAFLAHNRPSG